MKRRRLFMIVIPLALVASAAAFGYSVVAEKTPPPPSPRKAILRKVLADACGSRITYDRLKAQLFEEALDLRDGDPRALDLLAGSTVVRVEDPVVQAHDESLGVIVCSGEFILELPPGAEDAFDGRHRINARIEYAAQTAADGSGPVYRMRGAEPIVYRLAAFGLPMEAEEVDTIPAAMPSIEAGADLAETIPAAMAALPPLVKAPEPVAVKEVPPALKAEEKPRKEALKKAPAEKSKKKAETPRTALAENKRAKAEKVEKRKKTVAREAPAKALKAKAKIAKAPQERTAGTKPAVRKALSRTPSKIVDKKAVTAKRPVKIASAAKSAPKKPVTVLPKKKAALVKPAAAQRQPANACRASRRSAQILCANPALAAKERRTTSLYYSALENADRETASILRQTAGNFSTYLAGCDSEACVSQAFDGRAREIRDILADMR